MLRVGANVRALYCRPVVPTNVTALRFRPVVLPATARTTGALLAYYWRTTGALLAHYWRTTGAMAHYWCYGALLVLWRTTDRAAVPTSSAGRAAALQPSRHYSAAARSKGTRALTLLRFRPVVRAGQRAPARCHGEREAEQAERLKVDLPREKDALDHSCGVVFLRARAWTSLPNFAARGADSQLGVTSQFARG